MTKNIYKPDELLPDEILTWDEILTSILDGHYLFFNKCT